MLTYLPADQRPSPSAQEPPWLLLLLVFAWLWPGVFSHGLWNNEPQLDAAINEMISSSNAWIPTVLGEPLLTVSPAYIWVAAAFRQLLSPHIADSFAAARLASTLFTSIGLASCGTAGFHLLGRHQGRSVVLILVGSAGLLVNGHLLDGMSVQFASIGLITYGFALARSRVIAASLLLGSGYAMLAWSAGYLVPLVLILTAVTLLSSRHWQTKRYYLSLLGALLTALPVMLLYPIALYKSDAAVFETWRLHHAFGSFGGTADFHLQWRAGYYLKNLLWFAFPAWPLAVWTLSRGKLEQEPWAALTLAWLVQTGLLLAVAPQTFQDNLLWILPPLALLGAARLDSLRRGAGAFLNWFGIMTFSLTAIFLWLGFFAITFGWPETLAERAAFFSPYYHPDIAPIPMAVAILFTPVWLVAITRKRIRGRQAVTNWAAGMTLVWALLMTLFLNWLDDAKSYQPVVQQMQAAAPTDLSQGSACLSVAADQRDARLIWSRYSTLPLQIDNPACPYRLSQLRSNDAPPPGWQTIWQGNRPRSKDSRFVLLAKH